jgi:hypothetical protein
VGGDAFEHAARKWDGAGLAALVRGEDELAADDADLAADGHVHGVGIDVVDREAEDLALSETAASPESRDEAEPFRERAVDGVGPIRGPDDDAGCRRGRPFDRPGFAGVVGDQPVFDGGIQDGGQDCEQDCPVVLAVPGIVKDAEPLADCAGLDRPELAGSEVGIDAAV